MDRTESQILVEQCLRALESPGSFSTLHREPALGLALEVEGVGSIPLPLTEPAIAALEAVAAPSPFGHREETRHDPEVRRSREIPGTALRLDPRTWGARLDRAVKHLADGLGFPPGAAVRAEPNKLLLYREGDFFAPHQDSERVPGAVATMVLLLPSRYTGGEIVVRHGGEQLTHATAERADSSLYFVGFYADCVHEIRPVTSGCRVALTFVLHVEADRAVSAGLTQDARLTSQLARYFDEGSDPCLVYLLDHAYSSQGLDWSRLKNGDRLRTRALREAGESIGCACYLAMADVCEWIDIGEDGEEETSAAATDEATIAGLYDAPLTVARSSGGGFFGEPDGMRLELSGWVDAEGRAVAPVVDEVEGWSVVRTAGAEAREVYRTEHEPWTGNEGGTSEQWYHQAVLVLVPRDRSRERTG
ncbi:MAG: 2OG-Fe(II) oxygenase [Sandaracinaceae bacterium]